MRSPWGDDILSIDAAGVEVCPGAAPGDERLPVVTLKVIPFSVPFETISCSRNQKVAQA